MINLILAYGIKTKCETVQLKALFLKKKLL